MSRDEKEEELGASFRQARKEFWFMLIAWVVFATWTITYVGRNGSLEPGESPRLVLGMPDWVVYGVGIPWILGIAVTVWFATFFMKDTNLDPEHEGSGDVREEIE